MKTALLDILVDPISHGPVRLTDCDETDAEGVCEGQLVGDSQRSYPIRRGIPRFVLTEDERQRQTQESFGFKWKRRETYDSPQVLETHCRWMLERYGFDSPEAMTDYFASRRCILDAGCGSGFSSSTWLNNRWREAGDAEWTGLDISEAIDVAQDRLGDVAGTNFVQGDVLATPFADGAFDTVFSEGVLHHTPSTRNGIAEVARVLQSGGEALFYVYRRKGPIREFTDDHVRSVVSEMPEAEAWEALKPLTQLGRALAELDVEVDVPQDIPYLGIKAGRQNVQRLIYWNVAKMFWNSDYSFDENHHINFDWYHPKYAHRHTEEELRNWCAESGLAIRRLCEQESGYTIVAEKE